MSIRRPRIVGWPVAALVALVALCATYLPASADDSDLTGAVIEATNEQRDVLDLDPLQRGDLVPVECIAGRHATPRRMVPTVCPDPDGASQPVVFMLSGQVDPQDLAERFLDDDEISGLLLDPSHSYLAVGSATSDEGTTHVAVMGSSTEMGRTLPPTGTGVVLGLMVGVAAVALAASVLFAKHRNRRLWPKVS